MKELSSQCLAFQMAFNESQKAWTTTPMLARTTDANVQKVVSVFNEGNPKDISNLLSNIAGSSFAGYSASTGLDAKKMSDLGETLLRMFSSSVKPGVGSQHAVDSVEMIYQHIMEWLLDGSVKDSMAKTDLEAVNNLIGGKPQIRLTLLAPYAPVFAILGIVCRARTAEYPFSKA